MGISVDFLNQILENVAWDVEDMDRGTALYREPLEGILIYQIGTSSFLRVDDGIGKLFEELEMAYDLGMGDSVLFTEGDDQLNIVINRAGAELRLTKEDVDGWAFVEAE